MKSILTLVFLTACLISAFSQDQSKKGTQRLTAPFMVDSVSAMFFPVDYGQGLVSNPKLATFDGYFANILVYDFKKDTYRLLFDHNTFVKRYLSPGYSNFYDPNFKHNKKWLFLIAKPYDTNNNGHNDFRDASIAYVTDAQGENLKPLTSRDVNVVNIAFFEQQGFALLHVQRDSDGDKSFNFDDKVYYYQKVDLNDLSVGKPIELNHAEAR